MSIQTAKAEYFSKQLTGLTAVTHDLGHMSVPDAIDMLTVLCREACRYSNELSDMDCDHPAPYLRGIVVSAQGVPASIQISAFDGTARTSVHDAMRTAIAEAS